MRVFQWYRSCGDGQFPRYRWAYASDTHNSQLHLLVSGDDNYYPGRLGTLPTTLCGAPANESGTWSMYPEDYRAGYGGMTWKTAGFGSTRCQACMDLMRPYA